MAEKEMEIEKLTNSKLNATTGGMIKDERMSIMSKRTSEGAKQDDVRLLLIGKTGHGKSATGNTILSFSQEDIEEVFISEDDATSVTKAVKSASSIIEGRKVVVVDTPGTCDTSEKDYKTLREIASAVVKCPTGYDAFIIVIRFPVRMTAEEHKSIRDLIDLFGEEVFSYTTVVFTYGDIFEQRQKKNKKKGKRAQTFEEFIFSDELSSDPGAIGPVLRRFKGGVVLFNNYEENENLRDEKIRDLLQKVDELREMNSGKRYDNDLFQVARTHIALCEEAEPMGACATSPSDHNAKIVEDKVYEHAKETRRCTIL